MQSTTTASTGTPMALSGAALSKARSVMAILALSLGCFTFVSTELMPVGVLPSMAEGLNVSLGAAGYLVTGFAFMVALTAAPLTSMLGILNRKILMATLLAICCLGNLVTFLAPDYLTVFIGRIVVAAAIGVFWSTSVVTAVHLVSPKNAVRATSIVFGGVSLATVIGIPAGTLLGDYAGWRAVFSALTLLSLLVFVAVAWSVPAVKISSTPIRGAMWRILANRPLRAVFTTTALIVTGNFLAYTYIAPYLEQIARQSPAQISVMLLVYGAAGVLTNFAVAPFAARSLRRSLVIVTIVMAVSLIAMFCADASDTLILMTLAIWGTSYGALPVLLQTWVFKGASAIEGGADAATSINVSVYNAAIGMGALTGGIIINWTGAKPIPVVAAGFVIAALLVIVATRSHKVLS